MKKTKEYIILFILLIFACFLRLWIISTLQFNAFNSDQIIPALMAKHIAEGKNFPIFYYGQSFFGALESYLIAIFFYFFGFKPCLIYYINILLSTFNILIEYILIKFLFGRKIALLSIFLVAIPPKELFLLSYNPGCSVFSNFLQLLNIFLFVKIYYSQRVPIKSFLLFFAISGLLFWVWHIYIPVFFLLIIILLMKQRTINKKLFYLGILFFLFCSSPLWVYNLINNGKTFYEIFGKFTAVDLLENKNILHIFKDFIFHRIWSRNFYFSCWLKAIGGENPILFIMIITGIILVLFKVKLYFFNRKTIFPPITLLLFLAVVFFIIGHRHTRYLTILIFLIIPCSVVGLSFCLPYYLKKLLVILVVVTNIFILFVGIKTSIFSSPMKWNEIINTLFLNKLFYGYSDYWYSYPITFLTNEKIIVSPILPESNGEICDRYPKYTELVRQQKQVFILVPCNSPIQKKVVKIVKDYPIPNIKNFYSPCCTLYWPIEPSHPLYKEVLLRQYYKIKNKYYYKNK